MPPRLCYGDRWQELAIQPALHLSLDAMTGRYLRYWPESWHHAGRAPPPDEHPPASASIRLDADKPTRSIVEPKHCWAATRLCDQTRRVHSRIGDNQNKRITRARNAITA